MRVLRRIFAVCLVACVPAAALGSGCADDLENFPGLPNELKTKQGGAVSQTGASADAGLSPIDQCNCAMGVEAMTCKACFDDFTGDAGECATQSAACGPNTACASSYNCVATCGSNPTCVMGCINASNVSPAYLSLLACLCIGCSNSCKPAAPCGPTDGGDGG